MSDRQVVYDTLHEAFCNLDFDQNPGLRDRMYLAIEAANRLLSEEVECRPFKYQDQKKRFRVTLGVAHLDERAVHHSLAGALDAGWDADDSEEYMDGMRKLSSLKIGESTYDIDGDMWTRVEDAP